jgi:hypothetical protein
MHEDHDPHYEVLQHQILDILGIVKDLKESDAENTKFRQRVQGALVIIPVAVAVAALVINLLR